jgi:hypothetical protein
LNNVNQIKMNTKNKFIRVKGISQASINLYETKDQLKNFVSPSTDYFADWTTEKSNVDNQNHERIDNSEESTSYIGPQHRNTANKHTKMNTDANVSVSFNEIYNMAELFISH